MPLTKDYDILIKRLNNSASAESDEIIVYADGEPEIQSAIGVAELYSIVMLFWIRRDDIWALKCTISPLYSGADVATAIETQLTADFPAATIFIETVTGGGGGVTDHGALTGLGDDDHTQYHNNTRGDARYILLTAKGQNSGVAELDSGGKVPQSQIPLIAMTDVYTAASEVAQLAITAQEGDVVIRSDINKSYIHNGGSSGTMTDYSELLTPTDTVLSVNGETGAVSLNTDDISEGTTNKYLSATDKTDLTDAGSSTLHYHSTDRDRANHTGSQLAATISDFVTAVVAALTGAISTVLTSNLTASRAVQANASGKLEVSTVTITELGYVSGVTSALQTQLGGKVGTGTTLTAGSGISGGGDLSTNRTFDFAPSELSTVTPTTSDLAVIADNSDSNNPKLATISSILALSSGARIVTGSYTGNGSDNRNITGVGFTPKFVIVQRSSVNAAVYMWDAFPADTSTNVGGALGVANYIQAVNSDGFQVGTDNYVNGNTFTYYYLCIG